MPTFTFVPKTLVPKAFLPAIGYVTVAFSHMEVALNSVISALLGSGNKMGVAVTSKILNTTNRTDLARKLLSVSSVLPSSEKKELRSLINKVEIYVGERNRLIHDQFSTFTATELGEIGLERHDAALRERKPTIHSRKSIRALGRRMFAARERLLDFEDLIIRYRMRLEQQKRDGLPPSHGKPLQPLRKLIPAPHIRQITLPSPPRSSRG